MESLARDIKLSFPDATGFSVRNLKYMAKFSQAYPDREFVQTVSAQIPWSHNIAILEKFKDPKQRIWYIQKTAENGWSHSVLVHQIEADLYLRQAIAPVVSASRMISYRFRWRIHSPDKLPLVLLHCQLIVVSHQLRRH